MDAYNILTNPFTTTRPAVSLQVRQQFTQIDKPYTDRLVLGDLTAEIDFGDVVLTQITFGHLPDVTGLEANGASAPICCRGRS